MASTVALSSDGRHTREPQIEGRGLEQVRGTWSVASVRTVRTLGELDDLRSIWSFWSHDPNADPDYYLAAAQCPDFVRPHVIVVCRNGEVDCMLVGRIERRRLKLKLGYKTVSEPAVHQLLFVRGGLLGNANAENCTLLARELRRCLHDKEADVAETAGITTNCTFYRAVESEFSFFCRGHFIAFHEHYWLELPGNFKEFLSGMARKHRHEFRRHQKRLTDRFGDSTRIRCLRWENEVDELASEVEKIAAKTYQRALRVGFRPEADILAYLRTAARKGGLRGYVLYLENEPCAFFIGVEYKGRFYGIYTGFDPAFRKYSPGLLVLMRSIEDCYEPSMQVSEFDLGRGDRGYKRILCNRVRQDGPQYVYAPSWRGLHLNLLRSAMSLFELTMKKVLAGSGLHKRFKKLWQGRRMLTVQNVQSQDTRC